MMWAWMLAAVILVVLGGFVLYIRTRSNILPLPMPYARDEASLCEAVAEMRRTNDLLEKLVDSHEARIAALEGKPPETDR